MREKIQELSKLPPNSPEFEKLRAEIIRDHLDSVPREYQAACLKLQEELDLLRSKMTAVNFFLMLASRMKQNIDDLEDQLHALQVLVEKNLPEKPRLQAITRVKNKS